MQLPGSALGAGIAVEPRRRRFRHAGLGRRGAQRRADLGQAPRPTTVGRKAEVAHPHEPFRQDMQQKATDQLLRGEGHQLSPVAVAVVLVAQLHRRPVEVQQTAV